MTQGDILATVDLHSAADKLAKVRNYGRHPEPELAVLGQLTR